MARSEVADEKAPPPEPPAKRARREVAESPGEADNDNGAGVANDDIEDDSAMEEVDAESEEEDEEDDEDYVPGAGDEAADAAEELEEECGKSDGSSSAEDEEDDSNDTDQLAAMRFEFRENKSSANRESPFRLPRACYDAEKRAVVLGKGDSECDLEDLPATVGQELDMAKLASDVSDASDDDDSDDEDQGNMLSGAPQRRAAKLPNLHLVVIRGGLDETQDKMDKVPESTLKKALIRRDGLGRTPLQLAFLLGKPGVARWLLSLVDDAETKTRMLSQGFREGNGDRVPMSHFVLSTAPFHTHVDRAEECLRVFVEACTEVQSFWGRLREDLISNLKLCFQLGQDEKMPVFLRDQRERLRSRAQGRAAVQARSEAKQAATLKFEEDMAAHREKLAAWEAEQSKESADVAAAPKPEPPEPPVDSSTFEAPRAAQRERLKLKSPLHVLMHGESFSNAKYEHILEHHPAVQKETAHCAKRVVALLKSLRLKPDRIDFKAVLRSAHLQDQSPGDDGTANGDAGLDPLWQDTDEEKAAAEAVNPRDTDFCQLLPSAELELRFPRERFLHDRLRETDRFERNMLHIAADLGCARLCRKTLDLGLRLGWSTMATEADSKGCLPVHYAVESHDRATFEVLSCPCSAAMFDFDVEEGQESRPPSHPAFRSLARCAFPTLVRMKQLGLLRAQELQLREEEQGAEVEDGTHAPGEDMLTEFESSLVSLAAANQGEEMGAKVKSLLQGARVLPFERRRELREARMRGDFITGNAGVEARRVPVHDAEDENRAPSLKVPAGVHVIEPVPEDRLTLLDDRAAGGAALESTGTACPPNGLLHRNNKTAMITHQDCYGHGQMPSEDSSVFFDCDDPQLRSKVIRRVLENPHRLEVLCGAVPTGCLRSTEFHAFTWKPDGRTCPSTDMLRVHEHSYINRLEKAVRQVAGKANAVQLKLLEKRRASAEAKLRSGEDTLVFEVEADLAAACVRDRIDAGDTKVTKFSYSAARKAAGCVLDAVDLVLDSDATGVHNAFCAVRPPGHHMGPRGAVDTSDLADNPEGSMGFCLLNNVAIGAAYARAVKRNTRVAIVDFDVHHGNGTEACVRNVCKRAPGGEPESMSSPKVVEVGDGEQVVSISLKPVASFKPWLDETTDREGVFFASVHGYGGGFYPGSGKTHHTPKGAYSPEVLNIGVPVHGGMGARSSAGCSSWHFRECVTAQLLPALTAFRPDLIMISAGFDGHQDDLIGKCAYQVEDFTWVTERLLEVANISCKGRVVSVLEGGYNTRAGMLSPFVRSVRAHIRALMNHDRLVKPPYLQHMFDAAGRKHATEVERLEETIKRLSEHHRLAEGEELPMNPKKKAKLAFARARLETLRLNTQAPGNPEHAGMLQCMDQVLRREGRQASPATRRRSLQEQLARELRQPQEEICEGAEGSHSKQATELPSAPGGDDSSNVRGALP